MYKLIKTLAPLVLVVFISTNTFATMTYEEGQFNQDIQYKIYYNAEGFLSKFVYKPRTGDNFSLHMQASYKEKEFKDVKLVNAGVFRFSHYETQYGDFVYYLQAPSSAGTYFCTFEGTAINDEKYMFNVPIIVNNQDQVTVIEQTEKTIMQIVPYVLVIGIVVFLLGLSSAMKSG